MQIKRDAFTLIEVMVSVMIISVVIMALLKIEGNNSFVFSKFLTRLKTNQYASYLLSNHNYGFEKERVSLNDLLGEFRVEDNLRRDLKNIKVNIKYKRLNSFFDENTTDDAETSAILLELGKSYIDVDNTTLTLLRLRLQ